MSRNSIYDFVTLVYGIMLGICKTTSKFSDSLRGLIGLGMEWYSWL